MCLSAWSKGKTAMNRIFKSIIRIFSFPGKELREVMRQPRLILSLVLGPFLIILLFGLGYPDEGRSLRTTIVVSPQNPLAGSVESFAKNLGPAIIYQGIEHNKDVALANLALGKSDMVVVVPDNPVQTIQNNQRAEFQIYHNEVDPFQIAYIRSVGRLYTDEVNRRVLAAITEKGQTGLSDLSSNLSNLSSLNSNVLVSPFTSEVYGLSKVQYTPVGFLTPAVIILLLQHLSVTISSLSIVRERRSGIMELFQVAPLTALETLISKYLSYLIFCIIIAAVLTALVVWGIGVPVLGSWVNYSLALLIVLFASLGAGFVISLTSETEIQAVQNSMLLLLMSIFFSGFFLDLRLLWQPMKVISWSLPATYGIRMMQDVMLRGYPLPLQVFEGIAAIGVALFLISYFLLKRKMD
jgi:ABC-2 type transport system permease protein